MIKLIKNKNWIIRFFLIVYIDYIHIYCISLAHFVQFLFTVLRRYEVTLNFRLCHMHLTNVGSYIEVKDWNLNTKIVHLFFFLLFFFPSPDIPEHDDLMNPSHISQLCILRHHRADSCLLPASRWMPKVWFASSLLRLSLTLIWAHPSSGES